ncbi:hypothetical protein R6242_16170 [Iodobacter sp. CM08]|uniref:hypothetical protein n=1 Tax=Iodobacter sp. CM08 TaxID=3085902 RepID=UPI002981EBAD|nr:hypothetical protein [Iodobacter sp. CM08]MDW5418103.1 hypothetical protein [Iodobacter sp. CM08]
MAGSLNVDCIVGEHHEILLVEGHVDIEHATTAMSGEYGPGFPVPEHIWMRYADAPEGDDQDALWREVCPADAPNAKPVTASCKQC